MSAIIQHKNPEALQKVYKRLSESTGKVVAVGYPRGKCQAYPDGTPVAYVAAANVYGTTRIPRRDFMALAAEGIKTKAMPIMKEAARHDDEKVQLALMNAAGQAAVAVIQEAIVDLTEPPNAPATIEKKKSDNPLIDTSHMKNVTTYVVRDK